MTVKVLIGDVFDRLKTLESESVDCVVTSPPYWGLRDYGVEGQIGLEPTLSEHLGVMIKVFEAVRRVLKPTGTVWINYGDCYAANVNGRSAADTKALSDDDRTFRDKPFSTVGPIYDPNYTKNPRKKFKSGDRQSRVEQSGRIVEGGYLKPKDLCMVPNRLAIALQEAGWWVRSEIIWAKPNPMPESINDRPATSHEKIFLLSKSPRYFYDAEAVRVGSNWNVENAKFPDGWDTDLGAHGSRHKTGRTKGKKNKGRGSTPRHEGHIQHTKLDETPTGQGRNLRNWEPEPMQTWKIATRPFKEAHFATFPPELAARCIKAGSSAKGCCPDCGAPWVRIISKTVVPTTKVSFGSVADERDEHISSDQGSNRQKDGHIPGMITKSITTGWTPSCECNCGPVPAIILDPFGGAGTTGLVADQLGRDAILIELNPDYVDISSNRLKASLICVEGAGSDKNTDALPLFNQPNN